MKGKNKQQSPCIYSCGRDCTSMNVLLGIYARSNAPDAQRDLCSFIATLMNDYENGQRSSDALGLGETRNKIKAISNTTKKLLSLLVDIQKPGSEMGLGLIRIAVDKKRGAFIDKENSKGNEIPVGEYFFDYFFAGLETRLQRLKDAVDMPLKEVLRAHNEAILRKYDPPNVDTNLNPHIPTLSPEELAQRLQLRGTVERLLLNGVKKLTKGGRPIKQKEFFAKLLAKLLHDVGVDPRPQSRFNEFLSILFGILHDTTSDMLPIVKAALKDIPRSKRIS